MNLPWLTILTLVPLFGGIVVAGLGAKQRRLARGLTLAFSLVGLTGALCLWKHFNAASGDLQFVEKHDWVPSLGIQYFLGVDGLGLLMVMLTAIVTTLSIMASGSLFDGRADPALRDQDAQQRVPTNNPSLYYALMLWLQAGLFGTFTALNFFHWFLFWELVLIPAFFLIKLWGGPKRGPAATQFFIYTMVGSVTLLLSFLAIRLATGSFDFIELADMAKRGEITAKLGEAIGWKSHIGLLVFFGAFLGFAVKVPVVPFHTWLPSAYAEAPGPVTMLLTGVMSKMGVYGFLRVLLPIFPEQIRLVLTPLMWLAVLTIVLSACAAFAQRDLKRILAYSSINHLGYCLLALFAVTGAATGVNQPELQKAAALNGVLLQMFNHGLTASALFLFVWLIEKRSGGLRGLEDFGGIRKVGPGVHRPDGHRALFVAGTARIERVRWGIPDFQGRVPAGALGGGVVNARFAGDGDIPADAHPARFLRAVKRALGANAGPHAVRTRVGGRSHRADVRARYLATTRAGRD